MLNALTKVLSPVTTAVSGLGQAAQSTGVTAPANDPQEPSLVEQVDEAVTAVAETAETEASPKPAAEEPKGVSGARHFKRPDEPEATGFSTTIEPVEREDKVEAVDFARRAAIAAQQKAAASDLLGDIAADPFAAIGGKSGGEAAYAKSAYAPVARAFEPVDRSA